MNNDLSFYTADYIANAMSLRKPQEKSLKILEDIISKVNLDKQVNIQEKAKVINAYYPTLTDFEREFMSLTFALATGVGKTRLMGAFITYLYCQKGIKNFFIVAPGTTIFEKLKADLGDPSSSKYVFRGVGCFQNPPSVISDDDYRHKQLRLFASDINLFIFNIDKFNSDNTKMRQLNEYLGASFFEELSQLDDLVVLMDESHHYRAKAGATALNELKPLLGLELTATPLVNMGSKQTKFKNVVYEYPLSEAIKDGYTRTPYALTRLNIDVKSLGEIETDRMMLNDALLFHEKIKNELKSYASLYNERIVKPFMLIVCKDTEHAERIRRFICSEEFAQGMYANKTIMVHSKQKGAESDENLKLLLGVESNENPIEIVIHVNILKEGWDVNNLYTIVPLRTATSQILREQMVGRGLRLPFGKRTGIKEVDMVALAAHDNFEDLLAKAQSANSIFNAGNVIEASTLGKTHSSPIQIAIPVDTRKSTEDFYKITRIIPTAETEESIKVIEQIITDAVIDNHNNKAKEKIIKVDYLNNVEQIKESVLLTIRDYAAVNNLYTKCVLPLELWVHQQVESCYVKTQEKFIPIPMIKVSYSGLREYKFLDFDLDLSRFNQTPVSNQIRIQNLQNPNDAETLNEHQYIELGEINPIPFLAEKIVSYPNIDYELTKELLLKLLMQVTTYFEEKFGNEAMKNILLMFRQQICDEIKKQMLEHRIIEDGLIQEEVCGLKKQNLSSVASWSSRIGLFDEYEGDIRGVLFDNIQKGVFPSCKFDSRPELILARVLEMENAVLNWLRPAPTEFNIIYGENKNYEPDFVVETKDAIFLVEVKGEDKLTNADVLEKKKRAYSYCELVSDWANVNNQKEWKHLFIPSKEISLTTSFVGNLASRFLVTKETLEEL